MTYAPDMNLGAVCMAQFDFMFASILCSGMSLELASGSSCCLDDL